MRADAPTRRHLRHWERVCVYLDAQPFRSVRHPLPPLGGDVPPMTTRLFKRMAAHGLVRHTDDCRWQLARRWRACLLRLADGLPAEDRGTPSSGAGFDLQGPPFVADRGVDTLYVSLFASGVPHRLVEACTALKAAAQDEDATVETPWNVLGAPLSMYKSGVGTSATGRGVSWSFILRNAQVMLLLRKASLAGLVGSLRISAEALWTFGARTALDGARSDLDAIWEHFEHDSFAAVRWQLSQIHLCVDVARFDLHAADVDRLVSRSLKRALHVPSPDDLEGAWFELGVEARDGWDGWTWDGLDAENTMPFLSMWS
jgi:hypothetical protein